MLHRSPGGKWNFLQIPMFSSRFIRGNLWEKTTTVGSRGNSGFQAFPAFRLKKPWNYPRHSLFFGRCGWAGKEIRKCWNSKHGMSREFVTTWNFLDHQGFKKKGNFRDKFSLPCSKPSGKGGFGMISGIIGNSGSLEYDPNNPKEHLEVGLIRGGGFTLWKKVGKKWEKGI